MIKVTDSQGYQHLINPSQIVRVSEAGSASKYKGTYCHIMLPAYIRNSRPIRCADSVCGVAADRG